MTDRVEITPHDREYWHYQYVVMNDHLLPLLERWGIRPQGLTVLDVGCAEGGGLAALYDRGATCLGFDIEPRRIALAEMLRGERKVEFSLGNLYERHLPYQGTQYDLVMLHDVFEHLDRKQEMLATLMQYMNPGGRLLITFPPYFSAYGAHQQLLRFPPARIPFFHLLPFSLSYILPRIRGENREYVEEIQKLSRLRMGMRRFEDVALDAGMRIINSKAYIIGPNHIRFGLRPVPAGPVARIPGIRELVCSGVVYLLAKA